MLLESLLGPLIFYFNRAMLAAALRKDHKGAKIKTKRPKKDAITVIRTRDDSRL